MGLRSERPATNCISHDTAFLEHGQHRPIQNFRYCNKMMETNRAVYVFCFISLELGPVLTFSFVGQILATFSMKYIRFEISLKKSLQITFIPMTLTYLFNS
jgi:hypothetical protein